MSIKDLLSIQDSKEAIIVVAGFNRGYIQGREQVAKWVFAQAVPFNDPAKGVIAAEAFEHHMQELVDYANSQPEYSGDKEYHLTLKGNGALANAFKKVVNAMEYGGDLISLETASRCGKFAQEEKKKREDADKMQRKLESLKNMGIDPTSEEGKKFLAGQAKGPELAVDNSKDKGDRDELGKKVDHLENLLRELDSKDHEALSRLMKSIQDKAANALMAAIAGKTTEEADAA